jgi:hypothetical protein
VALLAAEVQGNTGQALAQHVASKGTGHAARLWNHWMAERFPAPGRVIDKTIATTRHIGLVASLLPDAPLIWLTRDPLDRAWSCYRTFFPVGQPWTFDQHDIAHHFRLEDMLLARWQDLLGDRLLVVPHEGLASDPDPWIRRILAHCGLAEEPACFAPQDNRRLITTASTSQVRRPINRDGIGSAEPYRAHLAPFLEAYAG